MSGSPQNSARFCLSKDIPTLWPCPISLTDCVPIDFKELIGVESGKKVCVVCPAICNLQSASAWSAASTDIARVDKKVR